MELLISAVLLLGGLYLYFRSFSVSALLIVPPLLAATSSAIVTTLLGNDAEGPVRLAALSVLFLGLDAGIYLAHQRSPAARPKGRKLLGLSCLALGVAGFALAASPVPGLSAFGLAAGVGLGVLALTHFLRLPLLLRQVGSDLPASETPPEVTSRSTAALRRYSPIVFWASTVSLLALAGRLGEPPATAAGWDPQLGSWVWVALVALGPAIALFGSHHSPSLFAAGSLVIAGAAGLMAVLGVQLDLPGGAALLVSTYLATHAAAERISANSAAGPRRGVAWASSVSTLAWALGAGSLLIWMVPALTSFALGALIGAPLGWLVANVWLPSHLALVELCRQRLSQHGPGRRFGARLATVFGAGFSPLGPGTVGALAALPLGWLLAMLEPAARTAVLILLTGLGIAAARAYMGPNAGHEDPQEIVVDESVGVLIALAFVPWSWAWGTAAFVSFRALDMWKPWPIRAIERRVGGALGVVLDDVAAGLAAGLLLVGLRAL